MNGKHHCDDIKAYHVGGYVRDTLLGLHPKDRDWLVVGHTPQQMIECGFIQVGRDFPVFLHPETKDEYALARVERKIGPGYRGFEVNSSTEVTLEDDLARRDFTINAMAMDADGHLIDPFHGERDLHAGILRHVGPAFCEDPVRILRGARFAARYGFSIAPETQGLMRTMVGEGEVDALTPERVWSELWKALSEAQPSRFIRVLHACGALERLFPELAALDGVPQPAQHHPEVDSLVHVLMALDQATTLTADPLIRFAVLVHDLGKGVTPAEKLPAHHGHESAGVPLVEDLCKRYRAPNECRVLGTLTSRYHLEAHRAFELKQKTLKNLFDQLGAFRKPERLDQFLLACEADARGRLGREDRPYPQSEYLRRCFNAALAVDSDHIIEQGYTGADIGEQLHKARIHAIRCEKSRWEEEHPKAPAG